MIKKIKQKKVFVALSGGVDSSVAAALLKEKGYDVVCVYMKNWDLAGDKTIGFSEQSGKICLWKEDRKDAMRAAAKIGVPFLTFDFSREYKKSVVEYMVSEYKKGRTPNPDVMCNKKIKFGLFLKKAREMGANFIATGHYVKLKKTSLGEKSRKSAKKPKAKYRLFAAEDKNKDQSYFLWTLTKKQLKYCLFPIGDYLKSEVRKMAEERNLPTAQKKDSQGLCFVGKIDLFDFLAGFLKKKKNYKIKTGKIISAAGEVLGKHKGVEFYTVGQRHGLGLGGGSPYYVVSKDARKNLLVVAKGAEEEKKFYKKEIEVSDLNWISGNPPALPLKCEARIRYRQPLQKCEIFPLSAADGARKNGGKKAVLVRFSTPQRAVSSGQSSVFYKNGEMLGGGVIV